jgi:exonuclease III
MSLRVTSWNAGGLKRRRNSNDFLRVSKDFDVIFVQESLIHSSTRQVNFPGFALFKKDAVLPMKGRPIGGLAFLVSFSLLNSFQIEVEPTEDCPVECLLLKFTRLPSTKDNFPPTFYLLNVYIPPKSPTSDYAAFQDFLANELEARVQLDSVIVAGDFNCHAAQRDLHFRPLRDFLVQEGFRYFPDTDSSVPTFVSHKGSSVIDFIFSRGFMWKDQACSVFPFEAFGHRMIACEFVFPPLSSFPLEPRSSF